MKVLKKEITILFALGTEEAVVSGGLGVVRTAELIGREKSQVSRALKMLGETGLVDRDPDTLRYSLGWQFFVVAARAGEQRLISAAPPILRQLVQEFGETAHVSVLRGVNVMGVLQESPSRSVQAASWVGLPVPSYCTSSGRALLLDYNHEDLKEFFSEVDFHQLGPNTVADVTQLYERIVAAREQGYARVDEEIEPGLVAVGAPIRDFKGRIVAALNVEAPRFRIFDQWLDAAEPEVKRRADELSNLLGWSSTPQDGREVSTRLQPVQNSDAAKL